MKAFIISMICITTGCASLKWQKRMDCEFIQALLDAELPNKILGLDEAVDYIPYVRIIDLTGKLTECRSFYRRDTFPLLVPYIVINELVPDINTGYLRDLVILDIHDNKGVIEVFLFAASFETSYNQNYLQYLNLVFIKADGGYHLAKQECHEGSPYIPQVDYSTWWSP